MGFERWTVAKSEPLLFVFCQSSALNSKRYGGRRFFKQLPDWPSRWYFSLCRRIWRPEICSTLIRKSSKAGPRIGQAIFYYRQLRQFYFTTKPRLVCFKNVWNLQAVWFEVACLSAARCGSKQPHYGRQSRLSGKQSAQTIFYSGKIYLKNRRLNTVFQLPLHEFLCYRHHAKSYPKHTESELSFRRFEKIFAWGNVCVDELWISGNYC